MIVEVTKTHAATPILSAAFLGTLESEAEIRERKRRRLTVVRGQQYTVKSETEDEVIVAPTVNYPPMSGLRLLKKYVQPGGAR